MGKFLTFEGCDGVGKSTQIRMLKDYLEQKGIRAYFTREPGGTAVAEKIREIILDKGNLGMSDMCELLLYSASRAEHVQKVIKPRLSEGYLVVCDRFTDSTFAYQGIARGMGEQAVDTANLLSTGGLVPDATIFLDTHPSEAKNRKSKRTDDDRLEHEGDSFQHLVYEGYKRAGQKRGDSFITIAAELDKHTTHTRILQALRGRGIIV